MQLQLSVPATKSFSFGPGGRAWLPVGIWWLADLRMMFARWRAYQAGISRMPEAQDIASLGHHLLDAIGAPRGRSCRSPACGDGLG